MQFLDLTGQQFGRWTVLTRGPNQGRHICWLCQCVCGIQRIVSSTNLVQARSTSCGCLHREIVTTHDASDSLEYQSWVAMKSRCYVKSNVGYRYYGGRGITVCNRWVSSFENFLSDMGTRPSPQHSLDRIDPDGHYSPSNCRWALRTTQDNNRRSNRFVTYNGRTQTVAQWSQELHIPKGSLTYRLNAGWSIEDAFTRPFARQP